VRNLSLSIWTDLLSSAFINSSLWETPPCTSLCCALKTISKSLYFPQPKVASLHYATPCIFTSTNGTRLAESLVTVSLSSSTACFINSTTKIHAFRKILMVFCGSEGFRLRPSHTHYHSPLSLVCMYVSSLSLMIFSSNFNNIVLSQFMPLSGLIFCLFFISLVLSWMKN